MTQAPSDPGPLPRMLRARRAIFPLDAPREAALRARIVNEALSWLGTPYRQLGATKGVCVDCCMLIVRVLIDSAVVEDFDPRPYPPLWFFHQNDERYLGWSDINAAEVSQPQAGDIVMFRFGRAFSHSGVMIDPEHLVHAFADEGRCTVSPLHHAKLLYRDDSGTRLRPRRFFDPFPNFRAQETAWLG